MENASKALLMAGGMLIALLILGSLVLLFANLQDYQNKTNISKKQAEIAEYNNQYEPFNKSNLTLMELKSVYNKIESNNEKNPEYEIKHNIDNTLLNNKSKSGDISNYFFEENGKKFTGISEEEKINRVFACKDIKYTDGRISYMQFSDETPPVSSWINVIR